MIRRTTASALIPLFLLTILAGCFSDRPDEMEPNLDFVSCDSGAPAPPANARVVRMLNFEFSVEQLNISTGTTVYWINCSDQIHTSTSDTGIWDSGSVATDGTYSRQFDSTGTFPYHCIPHRSLGMVGTITVS